MAKMAKSVYGIYTFLGAFVFPTYFFLTTRKVLVFKEKSYSVFSGDGKFFSNSCIISSIISAILVIFITVLRNFGSFLYWSRAPVIGPYPPTTASYASSKSSLSNFFNLLFAAL